MADNVDQGWLGSLEWAAAGRPLAGEARSGDRWVVAEAGGLALFGVIDGLGHGADAASAADRAVETVTAGAGDQLEGLFERCHQLLSGGRGCAMTLARVDLDGGALHWLGVGNVAATVIRREGDGSVSRHGALLRGGVLGQQLPTGLAAQGAVMRPGEVLLMATDGLAADIDVHPDLSLPAADLVAALLAEYSVDNDDALILAVRYRGPSR